MEVSTNSPLYEKPTYEVLKKVGYDVLDRLKYEVIKEGLFDSERFRLRQDQYILLLLYCFALSPANVIEILFLLIVAVACVICTTVFLFLYRVRAVATLGDVYWNLSCLLIPNYTNSTLPCFML